MIGKRLAVAALAMTSGKPINEAILLEDDMRVERLLWVEASPARINNDTLRRGFKTLAVCMKRDTAKKSRNEPFAASR